jgi:hypothetical protein
VGVARLQVRRRVDGDACPAGRARARQQLDPCDLFSVRTCTSGGSNRRRCRCRWCSQRSTPSCSRSWAVEQWAREIDRGHDESDDDAMGSTPRRLRTRFLSPSLRQLLITLLRRRSWIPAPVSRGRPYWRGVATGEGSWVWRARRGLLISSITLSPSALDRA